MRAKQTSEIPSMLAMPLKEVLGAATWTGKSAANTARIMATSAM